MRWIRDVRDEPDVDIDWYAFARRYRATLIWLWFGGIQAAIRMPWLMTAMCLLMGLPFALGVDWYRRWRIGARSVARRVPESERLDFPL
jgi:hypothetical protein